MYKIIVYVGTPENELDDYLYVDLVIDGIEFSVWSSDTSTDGLTGEQYEDMVGQALNTAIILAKLGLEISVDDLVLDIAEDIGEKTLRNVRTLVKEVL